MLGRMTYFSHGEEVELLDADVGEGLHDCTILLKTPAKQSEVEANRL